jgi:hypothetical protein
MKYLILIYTNPEMRTYWEALTDAQRADGAGAHRAVLDELVASGELVVSAPLADVSQAKRVAVRDGEIMTTDGPYAEVKEHLAGFYVLECESFERAVEQAAKLPEAAYGMVEVRPAMNPVWMQR